jgi:23S rRNA pseudouridine1911/1915/1917 synthase
MRVENRDLTVPAASAGTRLDRFLADRLEDRSRSFLRRLIVEGEVVVDGETVSKPGMPVTAGMRILVRLPRPSGALPLPEEIPLEVIHEDDELIVVVKPAGLVVHPGHGRRGGTLVNALLGRGVELSPTGAPDRPGIVHRLDKETSGLVVVAKTASAHEALARAFERRQVLKRYHALVWGHPDPPSGRVELSIGRSRANPLKMSVRSTRGRRRTAISTYRTLESLPGFALLSVSPETGRTHQIRVHMQSVHHPIVGDARYGGRGWRGVQDGMKRQAIRKFERLALHASDLAFSHPASGRDLEFHAPLPPDFEELLSKLRKRN